MNQQTIHITDSVPPNAEIAEFRSASDAVSDPVIHHLTSCILSVDHRVDRVSQLLKTHLRSALIEYEAGTGALTETDADYRGQLASWQLKRVVEMMRSRLHTTISVAELARACGLSVSHFNRSFKQTTGLPPHRWLMAQRIELAESLLQDGRVSLIVIAHRCGFSDQAAFTRSFKQLKGVAPGQFRRRAA